MYSWGLETGAWFFWEVWAHARSLYTLNTLCSSSCWEESWPCFPRLLRRGKRQACVPLSALQKQFWLFGVFYFPTRGQDILRNSERSVSTVRPLTEMRWSLCAASLKGLVRVHHPSASHAWSLDPFLTKRPLCAKLWLDDSVFLSLGFHHGLLQYSIVSESKNFCLLPFRPQSYHIASYEHVHRGQISALCSALRTPSHWPDLR